MKALEYLARPDLLGKIVDVEGMIAIMGLHWISSEFTKNRGVQTEEFKHCQEHAILIKVPGLSTITREWVIGGGYSITPWAKARGRLVRSEKEPYPLMLDEVESIVVNDPEYSEPKILDLSQIELCREYAMREIDKCQDHPSFKEKDRVSWHRTWWCW